MTTAAIFFFLIVDVIVAVHNITFTFLRFVGAFLYWFWLYGKLGFVAFLSMRGRSDTLRLQIA